MLASRRHRMRMKLYQSKRAIPTLAPSSNQKLLTVNRWKRRTAAAAVIKARTLVISDRGSRGKKVLSECLLVSCSTSKDVDDAFTAIIMVPGICISKWKLEYNK